MQNYSFSVLWSDEDGEYVATSAEFPGLSGLGATPEEAIAELKDAIEVAVQAYLEDGEPVPSARHLNRYSGQLRLRLPKSLHAAAAARAEAEAKMSSDTTQLPADVREPTDAQGNVWSIIRSALSRAWAVADRPQVTSEVVARLDAIAADCEREVLALLRTPGGEGEAMDADEIWNHWTSGHEDAALQGLRTATDDEAHRFLGMVADWQRCPKPSDHDAIAALRSEASGQGGIHPDPETWRCRQCGGYAAHYRDCPALRSEAQGEERASKYGALLAFADAISDAVWGGERAWEQDGGLERLSQTVRRWAKERAARRGEGGE